MGSISPYWMATATSLSFPICSMNVVKKTTRNTMPKMHTTPLA